TQQAKHLALRERQGQPIDGDHRPVVLAEVLGFDDCVHRRPYRFTANVTTPSATAMRRTPANPHSVERPTVMRKSADPEASPALASPESRLSGVVTDSSGLPVTSRRRASSAEAPGPTTRTAMGYVSAGTFGGGRTSASRSLDSPPLIGRLATSWPRVVKVTLNPRGVSALRFTRNSWSLSFFSVRRKRKLEVGDPRSNGSSATRDNRPGRAFPSVSVTGSVAEAF